MSAKSTLSVKRLSKKALAQGEEEFPRSINEGNPRPKTREECLTGRNSQRPCSYVSCKYHLYLDVNPVTGSIKLNFPDKEPGELEHSCVLDIAEMDGATLEEVGKYLSLTRERIRQIEEGGIRKLRVLNNQDSGKLKEHLP
jgi:hypothetical protein